MREKIYVIIQLENIEKPDRDNLRIDNNHVRLFQEGLLKGFRGEEIECTNGTQAHNDIHWVVEFFSGSIYSIVLRVIFSENCPTNNPKILYKAIWQNKNLESDLIMDASKWIRGSQLLNDLCYQETSGFRIAFDGQGLSMISEQIYYKNFQRVILLACLCLAYSKTFVYFMAELSSINMDNYHDLSRLAMKINSFTAKWYFKYPVPLKNNLTPVLWNSISHRFKLDEHYGEIGDQLRNVHALVSQLYRDKESRKWSFISFILTLLLVVLTLILVL